MYFLNRRPRGFHYTYRFTSERRDIIARLKRGDAPSDIAADTLRSDMAAGVGRSRRTSGTLMHVIVVIALLLGVLATVMALMLV